METNINKKLEPAGKGLVGVGGGARTGPSPSPGKAGWVPVGRMCVLSAAQDEAQRTPFPICTFSWRVGGVLPTRGPRGWTRTSQCKNRQSKMGGGQEDSAGYSCYSSRPCPLPKAHCRIPCVEHGGRALDVTHRGQAAPQVYVSSICYGQAG